MTKSLRITIMSVFSGYINICYCLLVVILTHQTSSFFVSDSKLSSELLPELSEQLSDTATVPVIAIIAIRNRKIDHTSGRRLGRTTEANHSRTRSSATTARIPALTTRTTTTSARIPTTTTATIPTTTIPSTKTPNVPTTTTQMSTARTTVTPTTTPPTTTILTTTTPPVTTTATTSEVVSFVPSTTLKINSTVRSFLTAASTNRRQPHLHTGPVIIGQPCHFTEQCKKIDPNANCTSRSNEPSVRVCVCRPLTFPSRNLSACIAYPDSVGDHCLHDAHCRQKLANTTCENNACNCSPGHFVDTNQTTCHKDPQHLGDFCQLDEHCLKTMNSSVCESNNTCVCHVNFTQASAANCTERPLLPRFLQKRREEPTKCQGACLNWTNSVCVLDDGLVESQCRCDFRFARRYLSVDCVPVQTYLLHLTVAKEMDRWDYKAVEFSDYHHSIKLNDSRRFADNITLDGLMPMFDNATNTTNPTTYPIIDRYVTSEVIGFEQTESAGVRAIILLHLTADYMNALPLVNVSSFLEESLTSSDGVLGESNFKVDPPFEGAFELKDFDECASDETNDCSKNAMCINTRGSFMCICKSKFDDVSTAKNRQKGRECVIPKTEEPRSDLCSSADCNTQWQFVAMAVTFFLLVVMAFITYEIIQRKQTFTARKLYEKFGTTQIRKLRKASMQRLKDRKKRMKEENRKKKEEERQKKDELKREKSDKRKKKEEGKQSKQDKKKQGDLEKGKKSADDSVEEIEEPDIESPSPIEATQTTSLIHASSTDDIQNIDIPNSQGSANMSDVEMGYSRRAVSPIEESPV